jgi:hypothetical protein
MKRNQKGNQKGNLRSRRKNMLTKDEIHTLIKEASQYGCWEYDFNILAHEKDDGFVMQLIERHESEPDPENPLYFIKASDKYDGLVMLRVDVDNVNDLLDGQKAAQICPVPQRCDEGRRVPTRKPTGANSPATPRKGKRREHMTKLVSQETVQALEVLALKRVEEDSIAKYGKKIVPGSAQREMAADGRLGKITVLIRTKGLKIWKNGIYLYTKLIPLMFQ